MSRGYLNRRVLVSGLLACIGGGAQAASSARYELQNSLSERSKWRSLGAKDWVSNDPIERARSGRGRIAKAEFDRLGGNTPVGKLKSLIALAEAGPKGYDAVHVGARRKTPKAPTRMTLREILTWIKATPGQPHAIGRYQFIPATLRDLIRRAGVSPQTRFSPALQDQFADLLLADAGLARFQSGRMKQRKFMNNLAKIWAGLPTSNGKSYYDGYAGNRATISRAFFKSKMDEFFRV